MHDEAWRDEHDEAWRDEADGWRSLALAPGFTIDAAAPVPELTARQHEVVDGGWAEARRARPAMFDGRVFALARIDAASAEGYWTSYRRAYAQLRMPGLFEPPLRALAVNGVLVSADDHVLLARRQAGAVYLPGGWQTPPAGSVEDRGDGGGLDLAAQLAAEAEEELGLDPALLGPPRPLLAIQHAGTQIVDIGLLACCRCDAAALRQRFATRAAAEYDMLETIPRAGLPALLAGQRPLLPTARLLLQAVLTQSAVVDAQFTANRGPAGRARSATGRAADG